MVYGVLGGDLYKLGDCRCGLMGGHLRRPVLEFIFYLIFLSSLK